MLSRFLVPSRKSVFDDILSSFPIDDYFYARDSCSYTMNSVGEDLEIEVKLPGVKKDTLTCTLLEGKINIAYTLKEQSRSYDLMLPSGVVDIVEASATLEDGILNIKLKKRNPAKRLIEIK